MKTRILILIVLVTAVSCGIRDDLDDCPSGSLFFELDDPHSPGDFDSDIGNDVQLHIFGEDLFHSSIVIPYDRIRGGQFYTFRKPFTGKMNLIAYAIPDGDPGSAPTPAPGDSYYEQIIRMEALSRSSGCSPRLGSLYLGKINMDENTPEQSVHRVAMSPCFAKVTVLVMDAGSFSATFPGTPSVGIEGTAQQFLVHERKASQAVEVHAVVTEENGIYTTGTLRVLPAPAPGRTLKVNLYHDGRLAMYVDTEEEAAAGKEITIKIYPHNLSAEIIVDGWTYKKQVTAP